MNTRQAESQERGPLDTLVAGVEAAREKVVHTVETAMGMVEAVAVLRRFSARHGAQRASARRMRRRARQSPPTAR